jgi:hypothetical protein
VAALVIGAGFLIMSLAVGISTTRAGSGLFGTLTWLALGASLAAGLFFTADSLSEEKRDGTLGFLFLTDLRGYDVVGGKLLATSLRGGYALLALFPVLALTLLMGGVTGAQFWKISLALINALFCSLAAGLLASAACRDSQRAMAVTFLLLLLVCAGGPMVDSILAVSRRGGFRPLLSFGSPIYVFWAASAWGRTAYWPGLIASHSLAWASFALASWLVPRTRQDRPKRTAVARRARIYSWKYGGATARLERRRRLIDHNPVMWLALRERWQSVGVWVIAGFVLVPFGVILTTLPSMVWIIWSQVSWLVLVVLYLWTASQACRFFVDAKRSGLMELLLVTPLNSKDIVIGQWRALLRMFGLPAALLLLVQFAGTIFSQRASMGMLATQGGGNAPGLPWHLLSASTSVLSAVANLVALMWFGMWMGLVSKNSSVATLRTILFLQVLPWLGISFVATSIAGLLMFRRFASAGVPSSSSSMFLSFPLVLAGLSAGLTLAKDAAFFVWARRRLYSSFRVEAARSINARGASRTAPGAPAIPVPPVIPAQL